MPQASFKKSLKWLLVFLNVPFCLFSQHSSNIDEPLGLGLGGAFNPFIFEVAPDIRFYIPLTKKLKIVPEYYHYGLNQKKFAADTSYYIFNEFYIAINLQYHFFQYKKFDVYLTGGYLFTKWINYDESEGAIKIHGADAGLGVQYNLNPFSIFIEQMTNTAWFEYHAIIGIKLNNFIFYKKPKKRYDLDLKSIPRFG